MPARLVTSAPSPTASRFQLLIATTAKVRAATSSDEKTASIRAYFSAGAPAAARSVNDSHQPRAACSRPVKNGVPLHAATVRSCPLP